MNNLTDFFDKNNKLPYFIAEISSNHGRDLSRCLDFIDCAADIGCDAVKFQLFKIDNLFSPEALNFKKSLIDRKNWELPLSFLDSIKSKCISRNIHFGCTPFYINAVADLLPYIDFYKIASYELLWLDLIKTCAKTGKPLILSTGMANISEIQSACEAVLCYSNIKPKLLHCTSTYPTPVTEANLSAINTIKINTNCDVGWSDHTVSSSVINRAVHKWGAKIIEFHLDLDGLGDEFSSGHCWLPHQIEHLISDIRLSFLSDGNHEKIPAQSELVERDWRADPSDGLRPLKSIRYNL